MKNALITGITGQDAAYLVEHLVAQGGYNIYGAYRRGSTPNFWRLAERSVFDQIQLIPFDLSDMSSIMDLFAIVHPVECYHLGAQSYVPVSWQEPGYVGDVNGLGVGRMLDAMRRMSPECRFYQASTSEMFGHAEGPCDETSPLNPTTPYACAKTYAHNLARCYREQYGLHISCGICFNHESPLRGVEFLTKKVAHNLSVWERLGEPVRVGNIDSKRDWGYAGDYVKAMHLMLQQDEPDDYVIATGEAPSVQDFIDACLEKLGIEVEWAGRGTETCAIEVGSGRTVVLTDAVYRRKNDHDTWGNPAKIESELGWRAGVGFKQLASLMVDFEIAIH